jgi:double-stranded uracil-DNA glycosylase
MAEIPWKPTKNQIRKAEGKTIPDILAPGCKVLFCGINPGLYSAAVGHHFARPGNRFWPALFRAGFTPRLLSPFDDNELLRWGYGITNFVERATAHAADLEKRELKRGARDLCAKVLKFKPLTLSVLGVEAYRVAFDKPKAQTGLQRERIGSTSVWIVPNPSGINAHYRIEDIVSILRELRDFAEANRGSEKKAK